VITDHRFDGDSPERSCQVILKSLDPSGVCGQDESAHAYSAFIDPHRSASEAGLRGKATSPEAEALEEADRRLPVRAADAAQYARPAIPEEQRGQIRVRLLNATPDPLGSVAALCEQYKGHVVRSLSEVTDEQRRACLDDMSKTVLNGPLEAVQFHWQIEGVTRSITHQMVRSRASFFAQESLRFAVPEGNWADEIPVPPSLGGVREEIRCKMDGKRVSLTREMELKQDAWDDAMINAQNAYERLIELGMPAEEARGVLPHDMPTRIHWVMDLRTLLAEAGKRTCTQAQFPWRVIFAGMASALRKHASGEVSVKFSDGPKYGRTDGWQFAEIADRLRPVCYQTGQCGFMAEFDRSCSIRSRVDANAKIGRPSSEWSTEKDLGLPRWNGPVVPWARQSDGHAIIPEINDAEWAADPSAARS
jgi:flavin-dependent thymidylate synthase